MIKPEHIVYWKIAGALFAGLNCYTLLLGWQLLILQLTGKAKKQQGWVPGMRPADIQDHDGTWLRAVATPDWRIAARVPRDVEPAEEDEPAPRDRPRSRPLLVKSGKKTIATIER